MILPAIRPQLVGDVPAYCSDLRTTFTGTLIFGVGLRDETARTAGLAHLVEHLVMDRVGRVTVSHNATTADESILFHATGSEAAVGDFLQRVGAAVSALATITDDDVARQRVVIAAELGVDDQGIGRGAFIDRFGNQGLGLLDLGSPAHRTLTAADVHAFARTWLHRGNAFLTFTGAVPDGFTLTLPNGDPLPPRPTLRPLRESQWIANGPIPLVLSLVLGPAPAAVLRAAVNVLDDCLLTELRTARQLLYSVSTSVHPLGPEEIFVRIVMDPRPESAVDAATAALVVLGRLAEAGPTAQDLAEVLDRQRQMLQEPAFHEAWLDELATDALRGRRRFGDVVVDLAGNVTAEQVRAVFAAGLSSRFITFAEDLLGERDDDVTHRLRLLQAGDPQPYLAGLSRQDLSRHLAAPTTKSFSPRLFGDMRGSTLIFDLQRVTLRCGDDMVEIAYDNLAAALFSRDLRIWALLDLGGTVVFLDEDDWRQPAGLHALLVERIPADRRVEVTHPSTGAR